MEKPLIDLIIISYNYGRYLSGAIESALKQTHKSIKITVLDDASTDETYSVAQKYPQVSYLRNENNIGLLKTLKRALNATHAPFFCIFSADDELETHFIETLHNALEKNQNATFAYCQMQQFGIRNDIYKSFPFSRLRLIHLANYISGASLVKREAYWKSGGFNDNMELGQEDWDLWLSFVEKGYYGIYVPKPLFKYRIHDKSKNYNIINDKEKYKNNLQLIRKNHPKLYGLSFLLVHYPYMIYDIFRTKFDLNG